MLLRANAAVTASFLAATLVSAVLAIAPPLILGRIVDELIVTQRADSVRVLATLTVATALAAAVLVVITRWLGALLGEGIALTARTGLFDHLQRIPLGFYTHAQPGAIVSRVNGDVVALQMASTDGLAGVLSAAFTLAAVLVAMMAISPSLTLVACLVIPALFAPTYATTRLMRKRSWELMQSNADLAGFLAERTTRTGAATIRSHGQIHRERAQFRRLAASMRHRGVSVVILGAVYFGLITAVGGMGGGLVYWFGGGAVTGGSLTVGGLVAIGAYVAQLYGLVLQLAQAPLTFASATASLDRILEVLRVTPAGPGHESTAHVAPDELVRVTDAAFRYPCAKDSAPSSLRLSDSGCELPPPEEASTQRDVLTGVEVRVRRGRTLAVVGESGSGKSTLAMLLTGLEQPTRGLVAFADDIRGSSDVVGTAAVLVTQDSYVFSGSLRENLVYGCTSHDDAELDEMCRAVGLATLIRSLPSGLDTPVGEQGSRLSGGQRQRIALVRALLCKAPLVVLDEPTSHLDALSEDAAMATLHRFLPNSGRVVVTHRLSTIADAEEIVVLAAGRIVERGNHRDLLQHGSLYLQLLGRGPAVVDVAVNDTAEEVLTGAAEGARRP